MGRMIIRSLSPNLLRKRGMDYSHEKPSKKARQALVDYYMERETPNYAFTFIYFLLVGFTCVMFGYAMILAVV
jgi:hypothetical protein